MSVRTVSVFLKVNAADAKAQLNSASKSLEDLAAKADKTGKVAQTGMGRMVQSAQLQKQAWSTVSTGLLATGAAAGAMVGVAVKKFADFDAAMSSVKAATHESAANMELLRSAAIEAGADTQYSATEAAGAIEELAKAGISTADILNGGLAGALNLAAAGGLEVGQAAEIAATALTQFKLKGSDVGHVADLLAAGAGKAQGDVSDLSMALKQGGLVASQTGLTIEETTAALSAFASAGLIGSDAGTSFKSMLQRLTPQSAEAKAKMDELGISAYDAGGNFIGLSAFAGNLHDSLKGLTVEQRNSAMATIFGSDAVRAASVLYDQGAEGISNWISQVDDAGFAAETAAARTDNLKGDLERLGGSLETVFIKSGSGANDALRKLVQTADAAVDAFGKLPEPVQQGALAAVALTAAGAGLVGIFMKIVPAIVETQSAMRSLDMSIPILSNLAQSASLLRTSFGQGRAAVSEFGTAFQVARATGESSLSALSTASSVSMGAIRSSTSGVGSALLGAFGGPVGLAVTGLTAVVAMYAKGQSEAAADTATLTNTLDEQTGALTKNTKAAVVKQLQDKGILDKAKELGWNLGTVTDAAMGNAGAMEQVAHWSAEVANVANGDLLPTLNSNWKAAQQVENGTLGVADSLAQAQAAFQTTSEATDESTTATTENAAAATTATGAVEDQTDALTELIDALDKAAGNALSLSDAQIQYQDSLASATDAIAENGATLDITTDAGRKNRSALDDIASSGWDLISSLDAVGTSQEDMAASMGRTREDFIKTAVQMGMTQDAAEALANQYGLIPDQITTAVSETGTTPTKTAIQSVIDKINGVPSQKVVGISAIDNASSKITQIQSLINSLQNKTVVVGVSSPSALAAARHADGGAIVGPGTGTSDDILMWGSNGEHMWPTAEVNAAGGQSAIYALRAAVRRDGADAVRRAIGAPGYASGGAVPREARVMPSYYSQPNVTVKVAGNDGASVARVDPRDLQMLAAAMASGSKRIAIQVGQSRNR